MSGHHRYVSVQSGTSLGSIDVEVGNRCLTRTWALRLWSLHSGFSDSARSQSAPSNKFQIYSFNNHSCNLIYIFIASFNDLLIKILLYYYWIIRVKIIGNKLYDFIFGKPNLFVIQLGILPNTCSFLNHTFKFMYVCHRNIKLKLKKVSIFSSLLYV